MIVAYLLRVELSEPTTDSNDASFRFPVSSVELQRLEPGPTVAHHHHGRRWDTAGTHPTLGDHLVLRDVKSFPPLSSRVLELQADHNSLFFSSSSLICFVGFQPCKRVSRSKPRASFGLDASKADLPSSSSFPPQLVSPSNPHPRPSLHRHLLFLRPSTSSSSSLYDRR